MRMVLPSIRISWISTMPATGLSTPINVAPSALLMCMKAPVAVWPWTVPRAHAPDTVTCAWACAAAAARSNIDHTNKRISSTPSNLLRPPRSGSQHVAREVFARGKILQPGVDIGGVDRHAARAAPPGGEGDVLEQLLHHGVEPARADVLGPLVDRERGLGETLDAIGPELELHALGLEQRLVLLHQAGVGRGEDALEVGGGERIELDADREAALQLGNQVGRLREMERPARDEQDVVGLHHAVARRDRRALDERQEVALHALARDVGALQLGAARDLVDLVQEHDAVLLDVRQRARLQVLVVDEPSGFLLGEEPHRLAHLELPQLL